MILIVGTCHNGLITRTGRYKHPVTGTMERGTYSEPCEVCEGRGCPAPGTDELRAAVRAALGE
jgi:hypothetical protein